MQPDPVHAVNDEPDNDADSYGQEGDNDANGNVPEDDCRSRLPHEVKHRRDVPEGAHAVAPGAATRWRRARLDSRSGTWYRFCLSLHRTSWLRLGARTHRLIELPAARLQRAASLNGETVYAMSEPRCR
jgi:hypothetical protein